MYFLFCWFFLIPLQVEAEAILWATQLAEDLGLVVGQFALKSIIFKTFTFFYLLFGGTFSRRTRHLGHQNWNVQNIILLLIICSLELKKIIMCVSRLSQLLWTSTCFRRLSQLLWTSTCFHVDYSNNLNMEYFQGVWDYLNKKRPCLRRDAWTFLTLFSMANVLPLFLFLIILYFIFKIPLMFAQDDQFIYNGLHELEAKLHLDGIAEIHLISHEIWLIKPIF